MRIIGRLNMAILFKNRLSPKFTLRQYFILYGMHGIVGHVI